MADPAVPLDPVIRFNPAIKRALNDVLGGTAASVLTVTFGLSYALLIFAGPLSPYLSFGVGTTFITSAILGMVIAAAALCPLRSPRRNPQPPP